MELNALQAFALALLQGITEFLPISSSGHLVLIRKLFGWQDDGGLIFDTVLHAGSFLAICIYFYKDLINTTKICFGLIFSRNKSLNNENTSFYVRLPLLLVIATLPVVVVAPFLKYFLSEDDGGARDSAFVGIAMIATALLFLLCDIKQKNQQKPIMNYLHSLIIGIFQIVALLPGASRSGWTTGAGILCGYSRPEALRFSFLMALPALLGAIVFNIKDIISSTTNSGEAFIILMGFFVSLISSLSAIHFCLQYFKSHRLRGFAIYLFFVGSLAVLLSF